MVAKVIVDTVFGQFKKFFFLGGIENKEITIKYYQQTLISGHEMLLTLDTSKLRLLIEKRKRSFGFWLSLVHLISLPIYISEKGFGLIE
jgi:hypothetical protein